MGIFSILAKIGVDLTDLNIGVKKAESLGKQMSKSFKSDAASAFATVFAVDKLASFGKAALDLGGKLTDLSDQLGVSVEFLQEMKYAAETGGSSLDDMAAALQQISVARSKALSGDSGITESFERLGISAEEIKSAKLEDLFAKMARSFEGDANPQNLVAAFKELAGRGSDALIPAMANGLGIATEQAHQLGLVMTNEVVSALDEANDRVELMNQTMVAGTGSLMANIVQPLARWLEAAGASIQTFIIMVGRGRQLIGGSTMTESFKHLFTTSGQAYTASLNEQDAALAARQASRKKSEEAKSKFSMEDFSGKTNIAEQNRLAELSKSVNTTFMGAGGDSLARIGGFSGYQSSQQKVLDTLRTQVDKLERIATNTDRTANAIRGE